MARDDDSDMNWDEDDDQQESTEEGYFLSGRDELIVGAAKLLLWMVVRASDRPRVIEAAARLLSVLDRLPKPSRECAELMVRVSGPKRHFGDHEIRHWWTIGLEGDCISIRSEGHFYQPSTGGDSFCSMLWEALPRERAELRDFHTQHWIVDDAMPFELEVMNIDLSQPGYSFEAVVGEDQVLDDE